VQKHRTRDDVLFWLNDRLGKDVHVSVVLDKGDVRVEVLEGQGKLSHWHEARDSRDNLRAWYGVDGTGIDLNDLDPLVARMDDEELEVTLAENVTLRFVEQA
jgi:hypothetical protein